MTTKRITVCNGIDPDGEQCGLTKPQGWSESKGWSSITIAGAEGGDLDLCPTHTEALVLSKVKVPK